MLITLREDDKSLMSTSSDISGSISSKFKTDLKDKYLTKINEKLLLYISHLNSYIYNCIIFAIPEVDS